MIPGGDELDEAGAAFMQRYGVPGYPTLLAVTAGGDLVNGDLLGGRPRDADYLFAELVKAQKANEAFVAERDRILEAGDAEGLRKLAMMDRDRANPQAARALLERVVREAPSPEAYEELARVLAVLEDRAAEREVLETMILQYPKHENRIVWRMRRATLHVEPPVDPDSALRVVGALAEGYGTLLAEVAKEGDVPSESKLRLELAGLKRELGELEAAQEHVDWVLEHAKGTPLVQDARLFQAHTALGQGKNDTARELAEAVLADVKEGLQAARAHEILGELAYGEGDKDAMLEHLQAVVDLAPGTRMAKAAQDTLDYLERRRKRDR